ncbi:MAG: hypothetical protein PHD97_13340 [Bacteroidales bacterium]|nr:hypothetical protein [Bacteroidales bacterium]
MKYSKSVNARIFSSIVRRSLIFAVCLIMVVSCKETSVSIIKHKSERTSDDVKQSHKGPKKRIHLTFMQRIFKPKQTPREPGKKETVTLKKKRGGKYYTATKQKKHIIVEGRKVNAGDKPHDSFTGKSRKGKRFHLKIFGLVIWS